MVIRNFGTETISRGNDLKLFSNDKLFVLVICFYDIQNFLCASMTS